MPIAVGAQQTDERLDFFEVAVGAPDVVWLWDGGRISNTTDGGRTWVVQRSSHSPGANGHSPRQIQFLDRQTGWVLFDGGLLHRTTDGGRTWQAIEVKPYRPNETAVAYLKRFQMVSALVGFGLDEDGEVLLRTTDGGLTWRTSLIEQGHPNFLRLAFLDAKRGWVSGVRGLYATSNGGQPWEALPPGPPDGAVSMQFRSPAAGGFLNSVPCRCSAPSTAARAGRRAGQCPTMRRSMTSSF